MSRRRAPCAGQPSLGGASVGYPYPLFHEFLFSLPSRRIEQTDMRKHWGVRVSLVILIALFLLAGGAAGEPKKAPIQIGAIHNVTGALGSIGGPSLAGALLAVKQLNKAGGVLGRSVELLAGDGQSDPAVVAAIARDLVHAPGLSAITGLNDTTMVLAAAPVSEKARASSAKQKAIPGALEATDDFPAVT